MVAGTSKMSTEGKRITIKADDPMYMNRPNVNGAKFLCNGEVRPWSGKVADVESPIFLEGTETKIVIGNQARMSPTEALEALDAAVAAWGKGKGEWPQMTAEDRIGAMEKFVAKLKLKREAIVNVLMWEICKVRPDAEKEFDRTMDYIAATIKAVRKMRSDDLTLLDEGGVIAQHHRTPIGVMLNLGPFNYPFNETYTTLIPAIIMGNTAVMKIPNVGALAHMETMEAFAECFPKGVVNFISGAGRETMPPIMATGKVDIFAFIGTSKAADALVKGHPAPHRLKNCLSLEAKNVGIVCKDADIDEAVAECALGSLSYNGQRCTAIKQIMVHKDVSEEFLAKFTAKVGSMKLGLPWEAGVDLTPLPEPAKPQYLVDLCADAEAKGAQIISPGATQGWGHTTVFPSIAFPVTKEMRVMQEEQFGPLIPIATFTSLDEVEEYVMTSDYGQQAAVFSKATDEPALGALLDLLAHNVARVNLNCQCQRSPDNFPFTGRKSSALGTLSVTEALKVMSMESLVATKRKNEPLVTQLAESKHCKFLSRI